MPIVSIGGIFRRELLTGTLIGLALAVAFLPIGVALWSRADVAVAVAVALFAACSTATVVAMTLPWLLRRRGHDPAFGGATGHGDPGSTLARHLSRRRLVRRRVTQIAGSTSTTGHEAWWTRSRCDERPT
jgi:Divalent cation transporter